MRVSQGIRRKTLASDVAEELRKMVLSGELAPGPTTQEDLAKRLGVSTMPVREALLRLAAQGLVTASPNKSFRINPTSLADVDDTYWLLAVVGGELADRACSHANEDFIALLDKLGERYIEARRLRDVGAMTDANWNFHATMNRFADAPRLLLVMKLILNFLPHRFEWIPGWAEDIERCHDGLRRAAKIRDGAIARNVTESHIRLSGKLLKAHFTVNGHWTQPSASHT
jgi:DNA-binding GntR family transcriptional regulator